MAGCWFQSGMSVSIRSVASQLRPLPRADAELCDAEENHEVDEIISSRKTRGKSVSRYSSSLEREEKER